jgi:hypothetical protein
MSQPRRATVLLLSTAARLPGGCRVVTQRHTPRHVINAHTQSGIGTMERHRKEEEYKERALAFHLAARKESENV